MKKFNELYNDLKNECDKLKDYYDIDKIKPFSVYVWTKGENGENVFDILIDRIAFYNKEHKICDEAEKIIKSIQKKLKLFYDYFYRTF